MKNIFCAALCALFFCCSNKVAIHPLQDGLYLVDKKLSTAREETVGKDQALVHFNPDFSENAPDSCTGLLVSTKEFVPLELLGEPQILRQEPATTKLELSFCKSSSEKLEKLSGENIMREAAMVISGEALTVHKIRDTIRNGKMEITGCSDKACEKLFTAIRDSRLTQAK